MPPKSIHTMEEINSAAFNILQKEGISAVTSRNIAKYLNMSVIPIYSFFSSMDELFQALELRAISLLDEYQSKPYTDMGFLNMGLGYIYFAREQPHLFSWLFIQNSSTQKSIQEQISKEIEKVGQIPYFSKIPFDTLKELFQDMWVYTHGLATLICSGIIQIENDEDIKNRLHCMNQRLFISIMNKEGEN